jgi:hypothetical protein
MDSWIHSGQGMTLRQRADRILEECGSYTDSATPFWIWLQQVTEKLRDLYEARECAVYLRQKDEPTLLLWAYQGEDFPGSGKASRQAVEVIAGPGLVQGVGILCAPIQVAEACLGVVELRRDPDGSFSEEEIEVLEVAASRLAQPIRAAFLTGCPLEGGCEVYDQASHRLKEVSALYEVGRALSSTLDLSQVLHAVTRLVGKALKARTAVLRLVDTETGQLRLASRFDIEEGAPCAVADAQLAERVRQEKAPVLLSDLRQIPPLADHAGGGPGSAMCAPLFHQKVVIGTLGLYDRRSNGLDEGAGGSTERVTPIFRSSSRSAHRWPVPSKMRASSRRPSVEPLSWRP